MNKIKQIKCYQSFKQFIFFFLVNSIQIGIEIHYSYGSYRLFFFDRNEYSYYPYLEGNYKQIELFKLFVLSFYPSFIGFFTQLIAGLVIDYVQSLWGKRRKVMLYGLIIWMIGELLCISMTIYPFIQNRKEKQINEKLYLLIAYIFFNCISFVGINIIQISYRAFILDYFDWIYQNQVYVMASFNTGLLRVVNYFIITIVSIFISQGDNNIKVSNIFYFVMQFVTLIIVPISVCIFCSVAKEQQQIDIPITWKEYLSETKSSFKLLNWRLALLGCVVFFGWICYFPFDQRMPEYLERYVSKDMKMSSRISSDNLVNTPSFEINIIYLSHSVLLIIVSICLYLINKRLDITISFSFLLLSLSSIIFFILPFEKEIENTGKEIDRRLSLIPYFISSLIYCHLNCLPYAMLRSVVQSHKFGFFLGLINCCVTLAQMISGVVLLFMEIISRKNDLDVSGYFMIFVCPFSILSMAISFALFLTYRKVPKMNERPKFDSFESSHIDETSRLQTSSEMVGMDDLE